MSINNDLYNAIESNESIKDKPDFAEKLLFAKAIYDTYDVNYSFDNIINIIKNIKIEKADENHTISYDSKTNTLTLGDSPIDKDYNYYKSFLQITSQSYNEDTKSYNNGIIYKDIDNKEYGTKINDLLISELITINTGLQEGKKENEEITPINPLDTIIRDCLSITGYNKLITYFAYGQGDKIFNLISSVLGDETTKNFYSSIDNYYSNPKKNELIYNMCINALVNSIDKDNGLKM